MGVIGCGRISAAYLRTLTGPLAGVVEVAACADLAREKAAARAAEFGVGRVCGVEELLADPEIGIVANLTIPEAHLEVTRAALEAGKHVYSEKPLALSAGDGLALRDLAAGKGLLLGSAPDTILGAGWQTCRRLLDEGAIGEVVGAVATVLMGALSPGYYRRGVGVVLDMGPYVVGGMIALLGPVRRLMAVTRTPERLEWAGEAFAPEEPAVGGALLEFAGGVLGQVFFATRVAYDPRVRILGTHAVLLAGDPNHFNSPVGVRNGKGIVEDVPLDFAFREKSGRGAGIADMALAAEEGRAARVGADLACHTNEVLHGILEAGRTGAAMTMQTTCARPAPMRSEGVPGCFGLA